MVTTTRTLSELWYLPIPGNSTHTADRERQVFYLIGAESVHCHLVYGYQHGDVVVDGLA